MNNFVEMFSSTDEGKLGPWTEWTCVDSCGETTEYRNRTCLPDPYYNGDPEECPPECDEKDLWEEVECDAGCCARK